MNWTNFLLWLALIYSFYYLTLIVLDLLAHKRAANSGIGNELTFDEHITPIKLQAAAETATAKAEKSEVIGSGGVPITDLFRLAKQEAIIYTRSVSF